MKESVDAMRPYLHMNNGIANIIRGFESLPGRAPWVTPDISPYQAAQGFQCQKTRLVCQIWHDGAGNQRLKQETLTNEQLCHLIQIFVQHVGYKPQWVWPKKAGEWVSGAVISSHGDAQRGYEHQSRGIAKPSKRVLFTAKIVTKLKFGPWKYTQL